MILQSAALWRRRSPPSASREQKLQRLPLTRFIRPASAKKAKASLTPFVQNWSFGNRPRPCARQKSPASLLRYALPPMTNGYWKPEPEPERQKLFKFRNRSILSHASPLVIPTRGSGLLKFLLLRN